MGEQIGTRLNHRSDACKFPSESTRKKQLLRPQGIKKSLNLHFRPNPILVTVSLVLILMASGLVIIWILIYGRFIQWVGEDFGLHGPRIENFYFLFASFGWSGITLLAGLMNIKKRSNLHFRPNPILVPVSLTLILMAGGLVIIWMLIPVGPPGGLHDDCILPGDALFQFASFMWFLVVTMLAGLIVVERVSMVEESYALQH